jgi:PKD repeat protein
MMTASRKWPVAGAVLALAAALVVSGCSIDKKTAPAVTGPSEFGLAVTMAATPDQLPRDGRSQSTVIVTALDPSGNGVAGQAFSLSTSGVSGVVLSAAKVTTDSAGRASFAVTAPPAGATGTAITIAATPVGSNFENAIARTVSIGISGASNSTAPTPAFTFAPASPEVQQSVMFDGSTTTDEGKACGTTCTYAWDFDDGSTGTGVQVTHAFAAAKAYNVALTVTDGAGTAATTRQLVTVIAPAAPKVTATVAPNPPLLNQTATFTATATVATGHSVRNYAWNFGDGTSSTTTGASATHVYSAAGTFVVTVTVTDDTGQTAVGTVSFTVSSGITVSFTSSPTGPSAGTTVFFNASDTTSSAGANISTYAWDFGDGSTGSGVTTSHAFVATGTYVVRLTVTDSLGRTATKTINVTVS